MKRTHAIAIPLVVIALIGFFVGPVFADARVERWAPIMKREAQFVYGLDAPVPMFLAQVHQESSGRDQVTAFDGGAGLAQFMPATSREIVRLYPELGVPDPYNARWAIRAQTRYMQWLYRRVQGFDSCEQWAAALKAYNAGLGYVQYAQRRSVAPDLWFGFTEYVPTRQSKHNFEYSRMYPRKILFKHQPIYRRFGRTTCI